MRYIQADDCGRGFHVSVAPSPHQAVRGKKIRVTRLEKCDGKESLFFFFVKKREIL